MVEKGFKFNFAKTISEFERAIQRFQIKRVVYKSLFRGKGLEFESYRTFAVDDDASMIDWKASLRANRLLAKQYVEERDLNFYFIIDVSNSMLFGSFDKLKAEYSAEVAASLAHLILNSGDKVGLIMFADNVVKVLHPQKSQNQFYIFRKFISDYNNYGGKYDFKSVLDYVLKTVKEKSVFFIISDFIKVRKECERALKLIGNKFETVSIMIRDPMDETLPKSNYQLVVQDPYSNKQMVVDPAIAAKQYEEYSLKRKQIVKEMFKTSNIDLLELHTNESFITPLVIFLKSRAKGGLIVK